MISKIETVETTYKLAIEYLGLGAKDQRPHWLVRIDDTIPSYNAMAKQELKYFGSKQFEIKPIGKDILKVDETDEFETSTLYIDTSFSYCRVSRDLGTVNVLQNKATRFKPLDGKTVNKIFFGCDLGVILFAQDQDKNADVYFGKNGEFEFVKGQTKLVGERTWDVEFPNDNKIHRLVIQKRNRQREIENYKPFVDENGRVFNAIVPERLDRSWDGYQLSQIFWRR